MSWAADSIIWLGWHRAISCILRLKLLEYTKCTSKHITCGQIAGNLQNVRLGLMLSTYSCSAWLCVLPKMRKNTHANRKYYKDVGYAGSRVRRVSYYIIACRVVCIHLVFSVTKVYNSTTGHNTSWHQSHALQRQTIKKIIRHFATICLHKSLACVNSNSGYRSTVLSFVFNRFSSNFRQHHTA